MLRELEARAVSRPIETRAGDILELDVFAPEASADVVVCMGDTLTHLSGRQEVATLFRSAERILKPGGLFVISFRDLASSELAGLDRFVPVRSERMAVLAARKR